MKTLTRRVFTFAILPAASLFAQDLAGTWQGTVRPPDNPVDLRTVIKMSMDGGALKAVFYSIDQTPQPFPSTVAAQGANVKITIPGIGAGFEGRLSADGNTITGIIKRGFPSPVSWTLKRVAEDQAWVIPKLAAPSKPMAADADPAFEVATIKLTPSDDRSQGMRIQGRTFSVVGLTLSQLIVFSYDVHVKQVIGLPAWAESERYNITAKPDGEGDPSDKQWRTMIHKLLADRFQLAIRREKKEIAVFAITAKGGSKLSKSIDPKNPSRVFYGGPGKILATNATIADFATVLQRSQDRPVVDQSGLSAQYDFTIVWTPDQIEAAAAAAAAPTLSTPGDRADLPPDLSTAVQQQLGLKLDATKIPIDVLTIDKAEKPSEN